MGIFSKIKNYITGGAADVSVVFENHIVRPEEALRLFVTASAKDDCTIKKVYLHLKCEETYKKRETRTSTDSNGRTTTTSHDVTKHHRHYFKELVLAEGIRLEKGSEDKWLAEFIIPADAWPSFVGKDCHMTWQVFAGLDMPGNDPDSGWNKFSVIKKMNYSLEQV
ncbi:MAG: hypothetical protein CMB80_10925 [Flammeovirgaceae bacterium]|nr:hypothetical protein [Flammeovirgaceae bacterium]MBE62400.1 hypothetical protein [Flammeovirgaceae bacterium]MBR10780.1 hypothetical protein [Rickettsiales bacterium]HCX23040.1 hypothetical protein [Cytophagales bacterium]|tara:strand:- start:2981 stop:3478 length:498 start_codon:yes stop_codon:yes gene_type:complete